MRVDLYAVRIRRHGDVSHLSDAPHVHHVRLGDVIRAARQELREFVPRPQVLAARYRHRQRGLDLEIALYVLSVHRLLEPRNVVFGKPVADADGARSVVGLVGVHHESKIGAYRLAQRGHAPNVLIHRQAADLRLHAHEARLGVTARLVQQPRGEFALRVVQTGRVHRHAVAHPPPKQLMHGLAQGLASDVPQRCIHRADGRPSDAYGDIGVIEGVEHPLPQPDAVRRILTHQHRFQRVVYHGGACSPAAVAPAHHAVVRSYLDQTHAPPVRPSLRPPEWTLQRSGQLKRFDVRYLHATFSTNFV